MEKGAVQMSYFGRSLKERMSILAGQTRVRHVCEPLVLQLTLTMSAMQWAAVSAELVVCLRSRVDLGGSLNLSRSLLLMVTVTVRHSKDFYIRFSL